MFGAKDDYWKLYQLLTNVLVGECWVAGSNDAIGISVGTVFDDFATDYSGADTYLDFGGGDSIALLGVNISSLHQDDFMFV